MQLKVWIDQSEEKTLVSLVYQLLNMYEYYDNVILHHSGMEKQN